MRRTVRLISGVVSPHQQVSIDLIPSLGRQVLIWLARLARTDAGRMFRTTYSRAARTSDKAARRIVTRWYVVERLLDLVERSVPPRPAHLAKLNAVPTIARADLWRATVTFATWFVREADTKRFATLEEASVDTPERPRKPPPRFVRKGRHARLRAYVAARASPANAPEGKHNDPLTRLQEELGRSMPLSGASARTARLALDRAWAGPLGRDFELPSPENVILLLSILVQLVPEAHVRDADLDSGVEPFLDGVLLELTRLHIGALWSADPSGKFETQLTRAFALNLSGMLSSRFEMENQSQAIDSVQKELEHLALPELQSNSDSVRGIFHAPDADTARSEADKLAAQTTSAVVRRFVAQRAGMTTVLMASHLEWKQDNMQAFCNAAVLLCQPFAACSPADVTSDSDRTAATLVEMFAARYGKKEDFSIAVPTTLVAAEVAAGHTGALARADTLRAAWRMQPLSPSTESRLTEEGPSTILLHYPTVVAHTRDGAVEWARRASAAEASLLWLALGGRRVLDVLEPLHSRARSDGATYNHSATSRDVVPPAPLSATNMDAMNSAIERVRAALASTKTAAMSRVLSAAMFAHMATQSEHPHERYLYLWLSLEALFGGLENDTDQYERAVSIGTRVAYRCALMIDPPEGHAGRTHGQFRWGITMELQGLYKLRNATVHSGQYAPVVNKLLEQRWRANVALVATRTMVAILEGGANTVEEVLAFRESRFPPGSAIA